MLTRGFRLGHYEIVALLGRGGMGEVYRAADTRLGRTIAIKVLPPELAGDRERRERLEREARIAGSLNHPHICTLHDVGEHDGRHPVRVRNGWCAKRCWSLAGVTENRG